MKAHSTLANDVMFSRGSRILVALVPDVNSIVDTIEESNLDVDDVDDIICGSDDDDDKDVRGALFSVIGVFAMVCDPPPASSREEKVWHRNLVCTKAVEKMNSMGTTTSSLILFAIRGFYS